MSQLISEPRDERARARKGNLQEAELRYLKENGPTDWVRLYLHFDDGTREIGTALGYLSVCKHVAVEDTFAQLTALGREQLKRDN